MRSNTPVSPPFEKQHESLVTSAVGETAACGEVLNGDEDEERPGTLHDGSDVMPPIGEEGDAEGQEDVQPVKIALDPQLPSAAEVERFHWPYRVWCKWCVLVRSLGEQRGRTRHGLVSHGVPIIGLDYFHYHGRRDVPGRAS